MDDLTDQQIKVLTEADIYRIAGDESSSGQSSSTGGPTPSEARAQAMAGNAGPNIPNF